MKHFTSLIKLSTAADTAAQLTFELYRFFEMLGYMGKGMLVIFVLIGVIVLMTKLISIIFSDKK